MVMGLNDQNTRNPWQEAMNTLKIAFKMKIIMQMI